MVDAMLKTALIPLVLSFIITSCSAAHKTFVASDFKTQDFAQATLAIAPLMTQPPIEISDEIKSMLTLQISENLYDAFIQDGLPLSLKQVCDFKHIETGTYKAIPALETRLLTLPDGSLMSAAVPMETVHFDSFDADYILFLENLHAIVEKDRIENSDPRKSLTVSGIVERDATYKYLRGYKFYFAQYGFYTIFDNRSRELVSYGKIACKTLLKNGPPRVVLEEAMADLSRKLSDNAPFKKTK